MRRRDVVMLLGGAAMAWPATAIAENSERPRRIGALMAYIADDPVGQSRAAAFSEALKKLGWINGRNLRIDYRWPGDDIGKMRAMAQELVGLAPDAMLSVGTPATLALKHASRTVPIVFVSVSDPVGQGIVDSLAHPGGNATGFALFEPSMGGKWLEMLKEITPTASRVAIIFNPETAPFLKNFAASMEVAARAVAVDLTTIPVHDDADLERAIGLLGREPGGALFVFPDTFTVAHRALIIELAARHRLPAIYFFSYFAADGGLLSYGVDTIDLYRRSAPYVDRVLKGEKPANLPVQQPTKFELVINLRTAKALGLTIPASLLARADEVIE